MSTLITRVRQRQIGQLLDGGKRLDGRGLTDYRELKVEQGVIERAEGSARVLLGKTEILVGVKMAHRFLTHPTRGCKPLTQSLYH